MQVWDYKEFQDPIRNELWSHAKAVEEEKAYKTETLRQPQKPKRDTFAEMEEKQRDIPLHRDSRRFVMVEDEGDDDDDASKGATLPSRGRIGSDDKAPREEYEMRYRPPAYDDDYAGEQDPLVSKARGKEKKRGKGGSGSRDDEDDEGAGETTPLYSNPVYVSKSERDEENIELEDGKQADSWV